LPGLMLEPASTGRSPFAGTCVLRLVQKKWILNPRIIAPIWKIRISTMLTAICKPKIAAIEFITVQG
jgi:hypothetical protein